MTYGFVRAKSWNCRRIVGRALISSCETDWAEPIRFGLMSGSRSAVTMTASARVSICELELEIALLAEGDRDVLLVSVLKPAIFTVTV